MKKLYPLLFFLCANFVVSGQSSLDDPVSIALENASLTDALYALIDEAEVDLSFPNSIIPNIKKYTFEANQQPLREVLNRLLAGTELEFKQVGTQVIIFKKTPISKQRFTVSGFVRDVETGERIIGATIYDRMRGAGTYSNDQGHFSVTLVEGVSDLEIYSLGYEPDTVQVVIADNENLEIFLSPAFLKEVVVSSNPDSVLFRTDFGNIDLNVSQVSKMPALGGEPDIFRIAYTLPGIQVGADGFGGISVRGGNVDQNLFLLDGVPVYNASHGIGIFSIFNSSTIRSAKILKGAFPAKYGGRLSSVWDIQTKEGNYNQFQGELDMGLSTGKLTLEGPISKGKGSVFFSGRRAFFDFFSEPITRRLRKDKGIEGAIRYYFYDVNLKANYQLTEKDRLHFSYYRGRDNFTDLQEQVNTFEDSLTFLIDDEKVRWGNNIASLRWNHNFSEKIFGTTTLTFSNYLYESQDFVDLVILVDNHNVKRDVLVRNYNSKVEDKAVKVDFDYSAFDGHRIEFGGAVTWHDFRAGITSFEEATEIDNIEIDTLGDWAQLPLKSVEFDAYIQDELDLGNFAKANIGFRLSALTVHDVWYFAPQPRLNLMFFPSKKMAVNASVSRVSQFLHLLSPSSLGLPKDLWVTATERIPPQHSWQFLVGAEQELGEGLKFSLEGYYRSMENLLIFKESSVENVTSINWQNKVSMGEGRAFGVEFLLSKESPKFGGWISYTLGKADRQFQNDINRGNRFPTKLDRRHNVSLQLLQKFNEKWEASLGFNYSTGTAFNFPTQTYTVIQPPGGAPTEIEPVVTPIDRLNGRRLPPYHRLDVAVNHNFWHRGNRHTLKFGFYNIYNRKNPLYFSLRDKFDENGEVKTEVIQVSLLPLFPTLRYSLQFK